MTTVTKQLEKIYYNPSNPASFSSLKMLLLEVKKHFPDATLKEVKEWLSRQRAYTLHKVARKKFKRNPILVSSKDELWQMDLTDMSDIAHKNDGYKYILTIIDVFSKYAFAIPVKFKKPYYIVTALRKIFRHKQPSKVQTDKGGEFNNNLFSDFLKKHRVNHYVSQNEDIKCAVVERFNRTLKTKLFKYFTAHNTDKYIDVLQTFVNTYNNTYHSTIKMKPINVTNENTSTVFKNTYGKTSLRKILKLAYRNSKQLDGDTVRISKHKNKFEKGYLPQWTEEVFNVNQSLNKYGKPLYKLKDFNKEQITGSFYPEEIQKVGINTTSLIRIEQILSTRKRGNVTEYFVKWIGYPTRFNSWVKASDIF